MNFSLESHIHIMQRVETAVEIFLCQFFLPTSEKYSLKLLAIFLSPIIELPFNHIDLVEYLQRNTVQYVFTTKL